MMEFLTISQSPKPIDTFSKELNDQLNNLITLVTKSGAIVHTLPFVEYTSLAINPTHHASIFKGSFYPAYNNLERDCLSAYIVAWLKNKNFLNIPVSLNKDTNIPHNYAGSADTLFFDDVCYLGYGIFTDHAIAVHLEKNYKLKVVDLQIKDPMSPHLIDNLCILNSGLALCCLDSFDNISLSRIKKRFRLISVSRQEALQGACNCVIIENKVFIPSSCINTAVFLQQEGFEVVPINFSAFSTLGFGCKSLLLPISN